ncbi:MULTISPECIES: monovalent cation/H+ antiporter subunit D family protein [unclassified Desulfurobacterium]|uniref:monovalent cation/H+ antiporter subunit D family protein n=1 Tax=Desulfurobacterium sp. TC5-1 TaxID=1158318 RepID=UPI0003B57CB0|nr:monovalent cation/H+ antiporter subunit D family protein [Desulfurobacterium sp. TC5-1]
MKEFVVSAQMVIPLILTGIAPLLIVFMRKDPNRREMVSFIIAILTFLSVISLVPPVLNHKVLIYKISELIPGISFKLAVDGMSLLFAIVSSFLWIFATSYNIGYMRSLKEHAQTRFFAFFALAIFGALGVAFSGNIFTMYFFYEIITVATFPLVGHEQTETALEGAKKYLIYLMGTSKLFLLPAMILTYVYAGTLDFNLMDLAHGIFPTTTPHWIMVLTYALYIAGIAKAAIMPLHNWLPSAMVAPTPVSALLHAVAVVKAGVFSIARVVLCVMGTNAMHRLHLDIPSAYLASFTILVASIIALTKDDLKARIAYSTISQLSYIVLGVVLLAPAAIQGGLFHIAAHAFSKITLFFAAGAIYVAAHLKKVSQLSGVGRKMPITFGMFGLATISMIGLPPAVGFVSKWYLIEGALNIHQVIFMVVLLISALFNAAYFVPIVYKGFFEKPKPGIEIEHISEAPLTMVIPLTVTAIASLLLGIYPYFFLNLIQTLWR